MVDTDWREILSFSQRELKQDDKETLCERLSWMEADDIELNFTDLKTLFRLAQDILKFKSEQVNSLLGQLETTQRKNRKTKITQIDSPSKSPDSALEIIAHQEEVIKANKEILEQLYNDIAELEGRKNKLEEHTNNLERDSDSSRDVLSEMDAVSQLENEITLKNRHIRKLLTDVKVLEEENIKLKEKLTIFKDKLTEATHIIENLTDQLFTLTNENDKLKEVLGKSEQTRATLSAEIESLRKELNEKDSNRDNVSEEIKSKIQHWKNIIRAKKTEIETLSNENAKLKSDLYNVTKATSLSPKIKKNTAEQEKIKELQEKLSEASNEMMQSAMIIQQLKSENHQLKSFVEDVPECSVTDTKNESDEGKERAMIIKLKNKNKNFNISLQAAEETIATREKELAEITAQLNLIKSHEGIDKLLEELNNKKLQLRYKDDGIKTLVKEVNILNETINDLQLENETMRQNLNIPPNRKIQTIGLMKSYREMEQDIIKIRKDLKKRENDLINMELENHSLKYKVLKLKELGKQMGLGDDEIETICDSNEDEVISNDGNGESSKVSTKTKKEEGKSNLDVIKMEEQIIELSEENEGLRKGLQEILDFLKDNSSTSAGVLSLRCPSLDSMLRSMEVRHAAGWFAPHLASVLELKAAIGGKDALLTALNEARKETLNVMTQLSRESQKTSELEQKLQEIQDENIDQTNISDTKVDTEEGEFGTWMSEKEQNDIDLFNKNEIETMIKNKNLTYEKQLRNGLLYFYNQFKKLFDKLNSIVVQAADDRNRWTIQEEQYKAQIENLKGQIFQDDDEDNSEVSPGIVTVPSINVLQRKCSYLEESYKYIRTLNENMKNEYFEYKKDAMITASNHEALIQKLMLNIANLTDKLRYSVSLELFWKQNTLMNDINLRYRRVLDREFKNHNEGKDLLKRMEDDKIDIIETIRRNFVHHEAETHIKSTLSNVEHSVLIKQLEQLCTELDTKNKQIENLESKNSELQEIQRKIIDDSLSSTTKEDVDLTKNQLYKQIEDNKILKEQCQHIESQLDIALLQLQDSQQRQLCNDLEINMLRHQILDLQSVGDNKAIVARLSGEILVAHLQASEYQKKIERLTICYNKEKQLRFETEDMLAARQKVFDVYASRYESKFRHMFEVLQVLRHQYQGNVPLISVEKYLNNIEEISRKNHEANVKLDEIEDLRSSLITKHSVFNQILDVSKNKCLEEEDSCQHKLEKIVIERIHSRELDHYKKKVDTLEQSREELLRRCIDLEKSLLHLNQGFEKLNIDNVMERRNSNIDPNSSSDFELEDVHSDDECSVKSNLTFILPKPKLLKPAKTNDDMTITRKENFITLKTVDVCIQANVESKKICKFVQTDDIERPNRLKQQVDYLNKELDKKSRELTESMNLIRQRTEELIVLNTDKLKYESTIQNLKVSNKQKDNFNEKLQVTIHELQKQIEEYKNRQTIQRDQYSQKTISEKDSLIDMLKQLEIDKCSIEKEYKTLLNNERNQFSQSAKEMQMKICELQTLIERRGSESDDAVNGDALKEVTNKYHVKISELENKVFKTQSELDGCKTELLTYQSEVDRWKALASERLSKMEHLNTQLEERHLHEVESYKAENDHWMTQLNEAQREHMELRTRLSEQKATYVKQLAEKDTHIEQLRSVIHGLKTQIMNMQTMISIADPSFDLSAIVEVEEGCDTMSHPGSERLELKFDSFVDLQDSSDLKVPASSTAIWQEPIIERLRREKQLTGKQNAILRRQIKAIAARERRARLDAQNLRNQVYRISTSGSKVTTAESSALHTKIASLQAQLSSARRETQSTVALWDKWKKAQQASERWRTRYDEKCREIKKLESSLSLAKSTIERLQKDKRVLMMRISEVKNESLFVIEKQDGESSEKSPRRRRVEHEYDDVPVSSRALMERIEAQQRRIVALETAEKGNEYLVAEYEKSLAEVTSLKGQVLKLESTLLEAQIRSPMKHTNDSQPELDYWKSYCEMLKEENVQLTLRVTSMESAPMTGHQHRVNDLEQTVLTLRGLVSKLQSEQKSARTFKHTTAVDSRPSSSRSGGTEKSRNQLESYRLEIANLKRSIQDKDLLLERSKEMLKIAAEREDDLLRENASLRRQVQELVRPREGFLSA